MNPFMKNEFNLMKVSFALIVFIFTGIPAQSTTMLYSYDASPQIRFETKKIKAEVFFLFEQTLFENGINVKRREVISANRYLYVITPNYGISSDLDFWHGELFLFHDFSNKYYLLESVSFESGNSNIGEVGDKIISELIIIPFKSKIAE
jgi:hypothetical protein